MQIMKISCSRLAWNSSDCFESFSPLNVTEGVITTWSNRMKFRLAIDLYKANDSLVQHKEIYRAVFTWLSKVIEELVWFWFYYALWLASVFTLVLVLRQSSENRSIKHYITSIIHNLTNIGIKILTISFDLQTKKK